MRTSFKDIVNNPMDLNRLMEFIANLSNTVDILATQAIGTNTIFDLHMEMLGTTLDGSTHPQVAHIGPWKELGPTVKPGGQIDLSKVPSDKLFFWSDTHYGHNKIINFANRPFADLDEMHEALVQNYNSVVGPTDVVVWIGDVSFKAVSETDQWLNRFNGYKILVVGNHDINHGKLKHMNFDEIHTSILFDHYIVTHHPWGNMLPSNFVNIHGHMHDRPFKADNHLCACVELIDYKPMSLEDLLMKESLSTSMPNYGTK